MIRLISNSEKETMSLGKRIGACAKPGDILCLSGDLGTGKTVFVKGLVEGLKMDPLEVSSPTFVFMNIYEGKKMDVHHFDLYRLDNVEQMHTLGWEEFLYGDGVSVIEWAERMEEFLPREHLLIELKHKMEGVRDISVKAKGGRYKKILERIK